MSMISIKPQTSEGLFIDELLESFARRLEATPTGACPIGIQLSLLQTSMAQTCGKCTPCREGIPQMEKLLRKVLDYSATEKTVESIRAKASLLLETADCAVGYHAGALVLEGLEKFSAEYDSHVNKHECQSIYEQAVPCVTLCPAHVNVPAYIALVQEEDFAGAINMVRKDNPFPTACALVCEHPCEIKCRRSLIDAPLNIRGIKKYAVDKIPADKVPVPQPAASTGKNVAVVGGGPSGLTCAYFAALMGHEVTVFEGRKQLGGMMRYGIPAYRLPRERLDEDIRAILGAGNIKVEFEHRVDAAEMAKIAKTFDAVYISIGAQKGKTLKLEGSEAAGVMSAVELLEGIGDNNYPDLTGKKVVVIGGGNVAMDCARTSVRAGAESVTIAYRRRLEDMTALPQEMEAAIAEGVEMMTLQAPARIEANETGGAAALVCQPQYIGPVKGNRPAPVAADKPEIRLEADVVLIAVGQDIVSSPFEEFGMKADRGYFTADEFLRSSGYENIFVGGDCQTGPKTIIMAIGAGKTAARNIDEFFGFSHVLDCGAEVPPARVNDRKAYGRVNIIERPANERKHDFKYVEEPLIAQEVAQECGRCLRCDNCGIGAITGRELEQW